MGRGSVADIYLSFKVDETDSMEVRRQKLYLGVVSMGEHLYCLGSHLSEIEKTVATMRKELDWLKTNKIAS
jgi:hypothetical protein